MSNNYELSTSSSEEEEEMEYEIALRQLKSTYAQPKSKVLDDRFGRVYNTGYNTTNNINNPTPSTSAAAAAAAQNNYQLPQQQHGYGNNNVIQGMEYINLSNIHNSFSNRFKLSSKLYEFKFKSYEGNIDFASFLLNGFIELVDFIRSDANDDDMIGVKIEIVDKASKPIGLSFRPAVTISAEMIHDLINSVSQSNAVFSVTSLLLITVTKVSLPTGGARLNLRRCSDMQVLQLKNRHIFHVGVQVDNLCLPKALLLAKSYIEQKYDLLLAYMSITNPTLLQTDANALIKRANVRVGSIGCNMFSIYQFQRVLPQYTITVYDEKKNSGNKYFCRAGRGAKKINLFYLKDLQHFVAIRDRRKFFNQRFECPICGYLYSNNRNSHLCKRNCTQCRGNVVCESTNPQTCRKCSREFNNDVCYETHVRKEICRNVFLCRRGCTKVIELTNRVNKEHVCHEQFCKNCWAHVGENHACFVKPFNVAIPIKFIIIFFDLECMQDVNEDGVRKHIANLVVASQVCEKCYDRASVNEEYVCDFCQLNKLLWFYNDNAKTCVVKFLEHLETYTKQVTAVCHNFRGYDSHFLLEELAKKSSPINIMVNGWKVMFMEYKNVRFVDSYNYMTMSLSRFPKTFDLQNVQKGYYPHKMNSRLHEFYEGRLPQKEMYCPENFNSEQLVEFERWYAQHQNDNFINVQQLLDYCIMDVVILKRGTLKFMKTFTDLLGVNPILQAITLPSSLMLGFRKNFLSPMTLGILPKNEYAGNKKQSIVGRKWLEFENRKVNYGLVMEYKLPNVGIYVDGYLHSANPQIVKPVVYEMFGCYWHMCPHCYPPANVHMYSAEQLNKMESTNVRIARIVAAGYELKMEWECKFKMFLKKHPQLDANLTKSAFLLASPLKCRDAIYGGLVDVFRTYYKCGPGEKIHALDFKSLYPFCQKYGAFPIGHPTIYRGPFECERVDMASVYGIIKCRILPPRKLFHPVLPVRHKNKMIMGLCACCIAAAENGNISNVCNHSEDARSIIGTWVLAEVNLAISKGYVVMEKFEIWVYQMEMINTTTLQGGIFTSYVNKFLTLKEQASGWPRENMTLDEKQEYIDNFFVSEGIVLQPNLMIPNATMRNIAKTVLNALWGKFLENPEGRSTTTIFLESALFFEHMARADIEVMHILAWGESGVYVTYRSRDLSLYEPLKHGVAPIGAFTTSYGRMCLYNVLNVLESSSDNVNDNCVLYCDTDSIFYVSKATTAAAEASLPIGDGLGQLTNLLTEYGENSYINEFVATGPKAYGFRVVSPDANNAMIEVNKCKGISCAVKNKETLNFHNLKMSVLNHETLQFTDNEKIKRRKPFSIVTEVEQKHIKFTYNKRVVMQQGLTLPYGF